MIEGLSTVIREVGWLILSLRNSSGFEGRWEGSQFKAKADQIAHNELERLLRKFEPATPIISEENKGSLIQERPESYWLIDPIDGTASFINGFTGFVTQVAFIENGRPKYSVIFAPALNELFMAEKGKGALLNGRRLKLHKGNGLETLIDNYPEPRGIAKEVYSKFSFRKYIECGSISLKICRVADGTADLFIKDVIVKDWDLAAPELVLEEAGGALTDFEGKEIEYMGSYDHPGIIAAHDRSVSSMIANWQKSQKGEKT